MRLTVALRWTVALVFCVVLGSAVRADGPPAATTVITIEGMHCPTCAKKVTGQLRSVPGVASVEISVEDGTAVVVPAAGRQPAPRALWQAVVKARFKPVRLEGPSGTFTGEPR